MEIFYIEIPFDWKKYRLKVEVLFKDNKMEQYKVSSTKGFITLESNRPYLRSKGLKHKPPNWNVIDGRMSNVHLKELIIKTLMDIIEK